MLVLHLLCVMVASRHVVDTRQVHDLVKQCGQQSMNNIKSRARNSCMSDDHAIYGQYTASVWKWLRHNAHHTCRYHNCWSIRG